MIGACAAEACGSGGRCSGTFWTPRKTEGTPVAEGRGAFPYCVPRTAGNSTRENRRCCARVWGTPSPDCEKVDGVAVGSILFAVEATFPCPPRRFEVGPPVPGRGLRADQPWAFLGPEETRTAQEPSRWVHQFIHPSAFAFVPMGAPRFTIAYAPAIRYDVHHSRAGGRGRHRSRI